MEYNRYPLEVNRRERRNSSTFSSTLLDAIYRSIDETDGGLVGEGDMVVYRETKKQRCTGVEYHDEDMARHRRACLIEKWMEKKVTQSQTQTQTEKVVIRRRSAPDFDRNPWGRLTHSSSSSSDSSSAGGFSSSEAESIRVGGRLASFLNSLFTTNKSKSKLNSPKICTKSEHDPIHRSAVSDLKLQGV